MNRLSSAKRAHILHLLMENTSMRGAARAANVDVHTILNLVIDVGKACKLHHDSVVKNIKAQRIQCDEIWSFCHTKKKNLSPEKQSASGYGDAWTWVAMDADARLVLTWLVGPRNSECAEKFIRDLASRLTFSNNTQLTTDGFRPYIAAIEKAFGGRINYAMLVKLYDGKGCYKGAQKQPVSGNPDPAHISTSYIERLNRTIRMCNRRFSRKTEAFSKCLENHVYSLNLTFTYLNFIRIHQTLRVTPAMEAGLTNRLWSFKDIVDLL